MIRKMKKGFTIVELVIVIAVIAILTAILVPTFISISNKADKASDQSLVKNLNTALRMAEGEQGDKNKTMQDAVLDVEEFAGIKLSQFVSRSGDEILWDSVNDEFCLTTTKPENRANHLLWTIVNAYDSSAPQTYSMYAGHKWSASVTTVADLTVGFDVGFNSNITEISYTRPSTAAAQRVVIRSDLGTVTVNAPNDIVDHYGDAEVIDVQAIAPDSYHEFGKVLEKIKVSEGHVVVESTGQVPQVNVVEATGEVKVTANNPTFITADASSGSSTTVVANSSEIYVSGDVTVKGPMSSEVIQSTAVSTASVLKKSLEAGGFYKLTANITTTSEITIPDGKSTILDFAGKTMTLSSNWSFANQGDLTLIDSIGGGGITVGKGCVDNYGILTVNGGVYTTSVIGSGCAIYNNPGSSAVINDCDVRASNFAFYNDGAYAVINGGKFDSIASSANGSNTWAYCVCSGNTDGANLIVNGGHITGIHGGLSINNGQATINNVYSASKEGDSYAFYALYIAGEFGPSSVTVNGGTYIGGYRAAAWIGNKNKNGDGGIGASASVNVRGGTFISKGTGSNKEAMHVTFEEDSFGIGYAFVYGGAFNTQVANKYIMSGHTQVLKDGMYVIE